MALTYAQVAADSIDSEWIGRVKQGILQYACNEPGVLEATPAAASDVTTSGLKDKLARSIIADPTTWANRFSPVVAIGFLGGNDLTEASVSDGAIYSRIGAVFADFFPNT